MKYRFSDEITSAATDLSEFSSTADSRLVLKSGTTGSISEILHKSASQPYTKLFYAQMGLHTGDSLITTSDYSILHLRGVKVIPDYAHVVTNTGECIADRFGSRGTFLRNMRSHGLYFGYNYKTDDFSGPYSFSLASSLVAEPVLIPNKHSYFLLTNDVNDKSYGHWISYVIPIIYYSRMFLQEFKPVLVSSYDLSPMQQDVLLTIFPWLNDFVVLTCKFTSKFDSLYIPVRTDEVWLDYEYQLFLRSLATLCAETNPVSSEFSHIYISRNDAKSRRLLNESDLLHRLSSCQFQFHIMSRLRFRDQVKLFASAAKVIYIAGAHHVNIAFCSTSARVCTIQSFDSILGTGYLINNLGLNNIDYSVFERVEKAFTHNDDFEIDIDNFISFLSHNSFL